MGGMKGVVQFKNNKRYSFIFCRFFSYNHYYYAAGYLYYGFIGIIKIITKFFCNTMVEFL